MTLPTITPEEAKRLVDQGATLIDIRGPDERAREHIPGSHHGPLAQITNFAGVDAPIIFHCRGGMRTASNAARSKMRQRARPMCSKAASKAGSERDFL